MGNCLSTCTKRSSGQSIENDFSKEGAPSAVVEYGVQTIQPVPLGGVETFSIAIQTDPIENCSPAFGFDVFQERFSKNSNNYPEVEDEAQALSVLYVADLEKRRPVFFDHRNSHLDMDIFRSCRKLSVLPEEETDDIVFRKNMKSHYKYKCINSKYKTRSADDVCELENMCNFPKETTSFLSMDVTENDSRLSEDVNSNLPESPLKVHSVFGDAHGLLKHGQTIEDTRTVELRDRRPLSTCRPLRFPSQKQEEKKAEGKIYRVRFDLDGIPSIHDKFLPSEKLGKTDLNVDKKNVSIVSRFRVEKVDETEFIKSLKVNDENAMNIERKKTYDRQESHQKSEPNDLSTNLTEGPHVRKKRRHLENVSSIDENKSEKFSLLKDCLLTRNSNVLPSSRIDVNAEHEDDTRAIRTTRHSGLYKSPTFLKNLASFEILNSILDVKKCVLEGSDEEQKNVESENKGQESPEGFLRRSSDASSSSETLTYVTVRSQLVTSSDGESDTYVTVCSEGSIALEKRLSDVSENSSSSYSTPPDISSGGFYTPPDDCLLTSDAPVERRVKGSDNEIDCWAANEFLSSDEDEGSSTPVVGLSASCSELEPAELYEADLSQKLIFDLLKSDFYEVNDSLENLDATLDRDDWIGFDFNETKTEKHSKLDFFSAIQESITAQFKEETDEWQDKGNYFLTQTNPESHIKRRSHARENSPKKCSFKNDSGSLSAFSHPKALCSPISSVERLCSLGAETTDENHLFGVGSDDRSHPVPVIAQAECCRSEPSTPFRSYQTESFLPKYEFGLISGCPSLSSSSFRVVGTKVSFNLNMDSMIEKTGEKSESALLPFSFPSSNRIFDYFRENEVLSEALTKENKQSYALDSIKNWKGESDCGSSLGSRNILVDGSGDFIPIEEEIKRKFEDMCFAFKADAITFEKRLSLLKRKRDLAEKNIVTEIKILKEKVIELQHCGSFDVDHFNAITDLMKELDIVWKVARNLISSSEAYGYVQHEEKTLESVAIMVQHLETIEAQRKEVASFLKKFKTEGKRSLTFLSGGKNPTVYRRRSIASGCETPRRKCISSAAPLENISRDTELFDITSAGEVFEIDQNNSNKDEETRQKSESCEETKGRFSIPGHHATLNYIKTLPNVQNVTEEARTTREKSYSSTVTETSNHRFTPRCDQLKDPSTELGSVLNSKNRSSKILECVKLVWDASMFQWPEDVSQFIRFYVTWTVVLFMGLVFWGGFVAGLSGCFFYVDFRRYHVWFAVLASFALIRRFYKFFVGLAFAFLFATAALLYLFLTSMPDNSPYKKIDSMLHFFGLALEVRYLNGPPPL